MADTNAKDLLLEEIKNFFSEVDMLKKKNSVKVLGCGSVRESRKRRVESSGRNDVLRGALTNLGKYNEGELDYVWVSFPCDEDDFNKHLKNFSFGINALYCFCRLFPAA